MYNINRVGENVTSIEEYDVASINATTYAVSGLTLVGTMHYSFDSNGKQFRKKYIDADGNEQKYVFEYQDEQNVAVQLPTGVVSHAKSDHFGRKVFDELQLGKGLMNRKFTYHEGEITDTHEANNKQVSEPQTTLVKQIEFADGRTIQYEYDAEERITQVIDTIDGVETKTVYTYDALGQLLTETVNDVVVNTMTYDQYGNIKTKNGKTYTYDATWKDKLTKVGSQTITYDANGNPQSYLGNTLVWEKGRQLKQYGANTYKYNNEGIRIKKTTSTEIHEYILDGTNIVKEIVTDVCNCPKYTNEYLYDLDGTVCGLKHDDTAYYFYKNLQGDVIAITNDKGETVARYTYDAWGKCTIVSDNSGVGIASINPFRYRSYYYDAETALYYLQSRYYNPEVGRFINADDNRYLTRAISFLNVSLFVYCQNNVINCYDTTGYDADYIYDQNASPYGSMSFGKNGNVADSGCGAVAVYNVLHAYSKKVNFSKLLKELLKTPPSISGIPLYSGVLGIANRLYNADGSNGLSVFSIYTYLKRKFFFVSFITGLTTNLWGLKSELSGAVIIAYMRPSGIGHYVAGIKCDGNDKFQFYNDELNLKTKVTNYVKKLKEKNYTPLCMVCVATKKGWW